MPPIRNRQKNSTRLNSGTNFGGDDVLVQVQNLITRFEVVQGVGGAGGTQDSSQLREIQKLAARIDAQFTQINAVLDTINRAQRIFDNFDGRGASGQSFSQSPSQPSSQSPRRSQDEWAHLFSRLVAGGFDNF